MKKGIFAVLLLIICISSIIAANCPPSLPKTYYGTVKYNGTALPGNFKIRALIGSDNVGISDVINGVYSIDISPCSGVTGQVSFSISGISANEKGVYNGMNDWGMSQILNLTINQLPSASETCGNGIIEAGEECDGTNLAGRSASDCGSGWTGVISCSSACRIDYSACTIMHSSSSNSDSNSGSSGNGGGGGGSSGGITPSDNGAIYLNPQQNTSSNTNLDKEEKETEKTINKSPITGSAVLDFVKSGRGLVILSVMFILLLSVIVILKKRTKNG